MFKKTIKYTNFNGDEVEKEFYFHLSKTELLRMVAEGSMEERLRRIIQSGDNQKIFHEFEEIIKNSIGVRSSDGETFIKTPEAKSRLLDSPAYDELMLQLMTQKDAAAEFIQNLLPAKMQQELREKIESLSGNPIEDTPKVELEDDRPAWMKEDRRPTQSEMQKMSQAELVEAFKLHSK